MHHPLPDARSETSATHLLARSATQGAGSYELVFAGVVLGLIGFGIDRLIGTTPILLIVFTVLGFIGASISLFYRYKAEIGQVDGP